MWRVVNAFGAFRTDRVVETLADGSDSAFCLAVGLVIVSGSHTEINLDIGYKLYPEPLGEFWISIRDDRNEETMD